jgi:transposase InsO family protein
MVVKRVQEKGISQRRASELIGISRSSLRYIAGIKADELELIKRIRELANKRKRFGYRRITALLRREGWNVNKKRIHRIWKSEGLSLPKKRPKRRRMGPRSEVVQKAEHPNHVWSYDFLEDRTENGNRLCLLVVLDEFTRESLEIMVERSINSQRVIDTLDWLFLIHGVPEYIRSDNGPEFIAEAVKKWLARAGCRTLYIEPGSPWENPYIESFNGKFRDECLNREIFINGREAQIIVEDWRRYYNEVRPHSGLGYLTPAEFAASSASSGRPTASLHFQNLNCNKEETLSF